ncbi:hypothetical protein KKA14_15700 [bacterium]|nr:hypothetical protein [bacterium]
MRVTELTKHNAVRQNLNTNSEELQNLLIGMSNGKVLNKPSDDPVGAAKVQDFNTSINHSKTLEKNISADKVWLNSIEETVKQITDSLKHVKELALEGANGSATKENRSTLANEIKIITKDLLDLGNKKNGKLYLLSGTKTFTKPLHMQLEESEPEVKFYGTRIKSTEKVIPLNQNEPFPGIMPGSFTIYLNDASKLVTEAEKGASEEITDTPVAPLEQNGTDVKSVPGDKDLFEQNPLGAVGAETVAESDSTKTADAGEIAKGPRKIVVFLDGTESLRQIIKKINEAAIAESEYVEDIHSSLGFKAKVISEIGIDNSVYFDPAKDIDIRFGEDSSGFLKQMGFRTIGKPSSVIPVSADGAEIADVPEEDSGLVASSEIGMDPSEFEARFVGYSKEEYRVKVIKGGSFGIAQVIISDDGGKNWSQPTLLQKKIETFNPDGKASNKIYLDFAAKGKPFFKEGIEFRFKGNEFVEYKGNKQIKEVLIDNGIKVALNINANQLFKRDPEDDDTVDVFDMLNRLSESMADDDQQSVIKSIEDIDKSINQVLQRRSEIGSTFRELESSEERVHKDMDFKADELSKLEDMDLAKGAVDLNKAELKNKVALDSSARLIQPTLINFLR